MPSMHLCEWYAFTDTTWVTFAVANDTCVMCSGDDHKDFMHSDLSLWVDGLPRQ